MLGFIMKPSKEQPPDQCHKMQGVFISFELGQAVIRPCKKRVRRLLQWIQQIREVNRFPAEEAKTFAGKAGFCTGRVHRQSGHYLVQPLQALLPHKSVALQLL